MYGVVDMEKAVLFSLLALAMVALAPCAGQRQQQRRRQQQQRGRGGGRRRPVQVFKIGKINLYGNFLFVGKSLKKRLISLSSVGLFDEGDSPSLRTSFQLGVESVADNRHLLSKSHLAAVVTSSSSSSASFWLKAILAG